MTIADVLAAAASAGAPGDRAPAGHGARAGEPAGRVIGRSREGRAIVAHRLGSGPVHVSLIAGCHADEPVGPMFLRAFVVFLAGAPRATGLLGAATWWIVPHVNPDGAERNRTWTDSVPAPHDRRPERVDAGFDVAHYLRHVVRERPGDDLEFGFPAHDGDSGARPETTAILRWWRAEDVRPRLHASLHGMGTAGGPWFLVEDAWRDRIEPVRRACLSACQRLGYTPHDVDRRGEKGFHRLGRGFATRPSADAMRAHFDALGEPEVAARFRPSSMDVARRLGRDTLTLVSEMPLFITPGLGADLDPDAEPRRRWAERLARWRARLDVVPDDRRSSPETIAAMASVREEASRAGLVAMPVADQLDLIWTFLSSAFSCVSARTPRNSG